MKINRITFTGPDDNTNLRALLPISERYPQVEWGILFSKDNGRARFPKWSFIDQIAGQLVHVPLSAHFCGKYVRDLLAGDFHTLDHGLMQSFERIQVNFHGVKVSDAEAEKFLNGLAAYDSKFEWILQMDGVNDQLYWAAKVQNIRTFPLFDLSGGEGIVPEKWPAPIGDYCGYAGGLGPHNLQEQLKKLSKAVQSNDPVWVDMETHVRNERDDFDLDKVIHCIRIAEPYF